MFFFWGRRFGKHCLKADGSRADSATPRCGSGSSFFFTSGGDNKYWANATLAGSNESFQYLSTRYLGVLTKGCKRMQKVYLRILRHLPCPWIDHSRVLNCRCHVRIRFHNRLQWEHLGTAGVQALADHRYRHHNWYQFTIWWRSS